MDMDRDMDMDMDMDMNMNIDMDTYVSGDEEIVLQPYTLGIGGSSFKQYSVNFLKSDYVFHIGCTDKKNKKNKRNKNKRRRRRGRV